MAERAGLALFPGVAEPVGRDWLHAAPHRADRLSGSRLPLPYHFSEPELLRRNTDRSVLELHFAFSPRSANARSGRRGRVRSKSHLCPNGCLISHGLVPYSAKILASVCSGSPQGLEQHHRQSAPSATSLPPFSSPFPPYSPAVDSPNPARWIDPHNHGDLRARILKILSGSLIFGAVMQS